MATRTKRERRDWLSARCHLVCVCVCVWYIMIFSWNKRRKLTSERNSLKCKFSYRVTWPRGDSCCSYLQTEIPMCPNPWPPVSIIWHSTFSPSLSTADHRLSRQKFRKSWQISVRRWSDETVKHTSTHTFSHFLSLSLFLSFCLTTNSIVDIFLQGILQHARRLAGDITG